MLEEIADIQSRIANIQSRIDALSPPAQPSGALPSGTASFGQALALAQGVPIPAGNATAPIRQGAAPVTTVNGQTIQVPPAALGPLPAMPVAPADVIPIASGTGNMASGTGNMANGTSNVDALIQTYAAKHSLPTNLVKAVIQTESGGNSRAVSSAGAMGLMQLMPANVREAGISDPFDPEQNIAAGTRQLAGLLGQYHGNLDLALAGYNAGPGNVRKYGGVPPFAETQQYIRKVRAAMEKG